MLSQNISLIAPNQTEAALLTGVTTDTYKAMSDWLRRKSVDTAIITMGEKELALIGRAIGERDLDSW